MTQRVELPSSIVPVRYNISLTPNFSTFTYTGEETIELDVNQSTNVIQLHSKEIYISDVEASDMNLHYKPTDINFSLSSSVVSLVFAEPFQVGKLFLRISFQGELNDQMAGFYRSRSKNAKGETIYIASTQFESLDARRCFPCWDEPKLKAIFEITLIVDECLTAFSNMPELSYHLRSDGKKVISFMPSPKMSTYLVAFCVGEFDFVQDFTSAGVAIRVYTPPGRKHEGIFSLKVAKDTLDMYDDFFKIPYPLPKMDMVAIPEFAMGAMENWGLVTYREVDLLLDIEKTSSSQKQRVCSVVTHELAHQWFGNLVTMEWWDDLWLNEGFATWMQTYAADVLFPEWKMWDQFVITDQSAALRLDSLQTSHPIQVPIIRAEEVEQVFDAISYCKGGCVVRMVYAVLGHEHFREGLALYMNRFKYSNTRTIDLWSSWQEVSQKPIREMMASWTEQMGFPIIKVLNENWSATEVELELQQQWFLGDGTDTSQSDKLWKVPVFIQTSNNHGAPHLIFMDSRNMAVKVPISSSDDWVKLNAGQHVPLRVAYTSSMIDRLCNAIRTKSISTVDRAGLIMDSFALARAGQVSPEVVFQLLKSFENEHEVIVWEALEQVIKDLEKLIIHDSTIYSNFLRFMNKFVRPAFNLVGWDAQEGEDDLQRLLRGVIIRLGASYCVRDEDMVIPARQRFYEIVTKPHSYRVPADVIIPLLRIVLVNGGEKEFNETMDLFKAWHNSNIEQKYIYRSAGSVASIELKERVLEWALSGQIKLQDFFYPILSVASSDLLGGKVAWDFYKKNFARIRRMIQKAHPSLMDSVIAYSSYGLCSQEELNDFERFFAGHPDLPNHRKISQTVEGIKMNIRFLDMIRSSNLSNSTFWANLEEH